MGGRRAKIVAWSVKIYPIRIKNVCKQHVVLFAGYATFKKVERNAVTINYHSYMFYTKSNLLPGKMEEMHNIYTKY